MQTSNLRDRLPSACYAGWLASVAFQLKIRFPFSVFRFPILYYVDIAKFFQPKKFWEIQAKRNTFKIECSKINVIRRKRFS